MWRLASPLMLTAFMQMAYNITDMMWIGQINEDAVAAAGLVGILWWIANAITLIPKIGLGVFSAHAYGEHDLKKASHVVQNGLQLGLVVGVLYTAFTLLISGPYIGFYNLGPVVSDYAHIYLNLVMLGIPFNILGVLYSQAYQSMGNSVTPFRINAVGLVTNIVMDPVLIFGIGPFPEMGIAGAAVATVFSQVLVLAIFLVSVYREKRVLYHANILRKPSFRLWWRMAKLGVPVAGVSTAHAIVASILSKFMSPYGAAPIAVVSIGSQFESIAWMTGDGFATAITSMVGQNYGAKRWDRVRQTARIGVQSMLTIGLIATIILVVFREPLFRVFLPGSEQAVVLGGVYLLIFGSVETLVTLEIGSNSVMNGLGYTTVQSAAGVVLNVLRIPLAMILMQFWGLYGIWIAMSISSVLKGVFAYFYMKWKMHQILVDE